jgi:hypothetical protein
MKPAVALLLVALALLAAPAYAQIELIEADSRDGARLDAPPEALGESGAPEPSQSPAQGVDAEAGDGDDDDGPDILLMALITIAIAGGAAVLFTLGYLLRRRIGFEPHRPPKDREEGEGH